MGVQVQPQGQKQQWLQIELAAGAGFCLDGRSPTRNPIRPASRGAARERWQNWRVSAAREDKRAKQLLVKWRFIDSYAT